MVGKLAHLQKCLPHFYGGGIVDVVSDWTETYLSAPERYEVGSPNYFGVVAMLKTMDILDAYGFDAEIAQRLADMRGIAVRQGSFCSHPYVCRLLGVCDETITECMRRSDFVLPGMVHVSFGIYNDESDVDALLECIRQIVAEKK